MFINYITYKKDIRISFSSTPLHHLRFTTAPPPYHLRISSEDIRRGYGHDTDMIRRGCLFDADYQGIIRA
ncbi:MAG: hypothetical protein J6Z26_00470 [Bacteroidales bacterium]|nr:hypothetical protein [Bacteroidales bacterium]